MTPATDSVAGVSDSGVSGSGVSGSGERRRDGHIVLVPYHRDLRHLSSALHSLIAQTDPDWRAVVVDDSPRDAAPSEGSTACRRLVAGLDDARIAYERPSVPLGVAAAFNRCFELAAESSASHATLLHADDELAPGYVAAVAATHALHPSAACVAPRVEVIAGDGSPIRPLADRAKAALWPRRSDVIVGDRGLARLLHGQFLYCPSVSFRTDITRASGWDGRWAQVMDLDLFCRLLLDGQHIALCDERVYRYRRHADSTTSHNTASARRLEEETRLCREIGTIAAGRGWRRAVWASRLRTTVRLHGLLQAAGACVGRDVGRGRHLAALALGR